ncbi:hypothetical protein RQP53_17015 [Paucibacter sp. APW11]|uniref:Pilus formation protein N-terminal domain-containing protein n=1 Tax=Roseateles aquae TaxID=3077235 RepID=A0ABU3PEF3_9BURK|nr:hypothetical protein [Paucibacter sp. APW11]MDT9000981.1 hypothetical protein [Paucibacter sp. APW11]
MNTSTQAFVFGLAGTIALAAGLSVSAAQAERANIVRLAPVVVVGQHIGGKVVTAQIERLPTVYVLGRSNGTAAVVAQAATQCLPQTMC